MSPFAKALSGLFDETGLFSRKDWATFLTVSEETIEEWLNDEDIPSPQKLKMCLNILEESDRIPPKPLNGFREICERRASDISPLGDLMLPNVKTYLERVRGAHPLNSELRWLSRNDQAQKLRELFPA